MGLTLHASLQTDLARWYPDWLFARLEAGMFDCRKARRKICRYQFSPDTVDRLVIWSKNPRGLIKKDTPLEKLPYNWHLILEYVACDSYVEPQIRNKDRLLSAFAKFADRFSPDRFGFCYGPVYLNSSTDIDYHVGQFDFLCCLYQGKVSDVYVDFQAVESCSGQGRYNLRCLNESEREEAFARMQETAARYGFELMEKPDPRSLSLQEADMGMPEACPGQCKICAHTQNRRNGEMAMKKHEADSSMLVGHPLPGEPVQIMSPPERPAIKKKADSGLGLKKLTRRSG